MKQPTSLFCFRKGYFFLTVFLFVVEVMIAVFLNDSFVRPYLGDFLVVILLYCFVRSFFNFSVMPVAIGVLLFAYAIEAAQYFRLLSHLGLQQNNTARVVLGSSFDWQDILAYTAGILVIIWIEKQRVKQSSKSSGNC